MPSGTWKAKGYPDNPPFKLGAHQLPEGNRALPMKLALMTALGDERGDDSTAEIRNLKLRS